MAPPEANNSPSNSDFPVLDFDEDLPAFSEEEDLSAFDEEEDVSTFNEEEKEIPCNFSSNAEKTNAEITKDEGPICEKPPAADGSNSDPDGSFSEIEGTKDRIIASAPSVQVSEGEPSSRAENVSSLPLSSSLPADHGGPRDGPERQIRCARTPPPQAWPPMHAALSLTGRRDNMEDFVWAEPEFLWGLDFYAVYDGHGGRGVAEWCQQRMPLVVAGRVWANHWNRQWTKIMEESFHMMDQEVVAVEDKTAGSTAVVAVVSERDIVVANCGDSRAVLSRGGVAFPLSEDHKPDRPDERERILAVGGRIVNWNGCRVEGVLATSRSIGDEYLKPYISAKPEITVMERNERDEFLILASDGLWDVISNEQACNIVRGYVSGDSCFAVEQAASSLVRFAMCNGSEDNISVVVAMLRELNPKRQSQPLPVSSGP